MNILIPDSWLRHFLSTNAKPKDIAQALTLCGPTVDKVEKTDNDFIYDIEVTTNRVDLMSVFGIAREACAILPQFGFSAKLKTLKSPSVISKKQLDIKIVDRNKFSKRTLAIKLGNIKLGPTPQWMAEKLIKVGQRPLLNAIDITNYVMWELGHPIHVFDYDLIKEKQIVVRLAAKGENITTLDNKVYVLQGGEIVFDDGKGIIIDLPGIMGTANSVVTQKTKNVLLLIESLDPEKIRYASMGLGIRSQAAILNEKNVDPECAYPTILQAIELFKGICQAKEESKLVDIYPKRYSPKHLYVDLNYINHKLGVPIEGKRVKNILEQLGFGVRLIKDKVIVTVPSYRANDIFIEDDIVEEVARIYGYHHLPGTLMAGSLPEKPQNSPFYFELKIKNILKALKASETYTLSFVAHEDSSNKAIRLSNPLGSDMEYLRTTLRPSLYLATESNSGYKDSFHLFEMANVYLAQEGNLPNEKMMLAGIFSNYKYRNAKGVIESLLNQLNISYSFIVEDKIHFLPSQRLIIKCKNVTIGEFGVLENNFIYYEFDTESLREYAKTISTYYPFPKYPAQIEDLTFSFPSRTMIGEVIKTINKQKEITRVRLIDTFKDSYTFRVWYQNLNKTLTDKEVENIRSNLLKRLKEKIGARIKN